MSRRWGELGSVGDERARELLQRFAPAVDGAVRAFVAGGARVGLEPDDLRQLARLAVLDAALSHDGRASLGHWVRKTIRWRLTEAVLAEERPEEPLEAPERVVNGENPEELVERLHLVSWVRGAVDGLDVRQRTILACRLEGETLRQIAASLGISATRVHQETKRAHQRLRQAVREHLDAEDLGS
ncbi:MAG TPA: sigma-70 family RNA polymerase sigma factor [Myxococcota bacterium]